MLENYKDIAKNFVGSRTKDNEDFNNFLNFLMPEYERNCFIEYVGG